MPTRVTYFRGLGRFSLRQPEPGLGRLSSFFNPASGSIDLPTLAVSLVLPTEEQTTVLFLIFNPFGFQAWFGTFRLASPSQLVRHTAILSNTQCVLRTHLQTNKLDKKICDHLPSISLESLQRSATIECRKKFGCFFGQKRPLEERVACSVDHSVSRHQHCSSHGRTIVG